MRASGSERANPRRGCAEIKGLLGRHDDTALFPAGLSLDEAAEDKVVGSEVLTRTYQRFLLAEYRKVDDGAALAALVVAHAPVRFEPLLQVLRDMAKR
jgi:hypothetical protein